VRFLALLALAATLSAQPSGNVRLVVVEPGHFHASLLQRETYPRVAPRVSVYAPLGPELLDYLTRVSAFNSRPDHPTDWQLDVHTSPDFFDRMLADRPGNVVVFSGRNNEKMDRILRCLQAGLNVLADKPWIITSAQIPQLAQALDLAESKNLVAYDIMTERYEITSILQKELVNDDQIFGALVPGTVADPAINVRGVHYLLKTVAGLPLKRPTWFLNIDQNGEGIADVGAHLVDLIDWTAFPTRRLDYRTDIQLVSARRWPTVISADQFTKMTGEKAFPDHLKSWIKDNRFDYFSNHEIHYTAAGRHIAIDTRWDWEAEPGAGDVYEAAYRGTKSRIEIRQGRATNFRAELYVVSADPAVLSAVKYKLALLAKDRPGLDCRYQSGEIHVLIPDRYRVTHEEHFAQVAKAFLGYLQNPKSLPPWEKSNMLVKYFITTRSVEMSRAARP
jgi:predicted dehydrogenase